MTFVNRWIIGARPRTLPAAVVPVAIGAGAAVGGPSPVWWRVVPALVVSLALQIGVNYSNDYSDGIRGTDAVRVGPVRLVASGLASASAVKRAAFASFAVAALAGLGLAAAAGWWLIATLVAIFPANVEMAVHAERFAPLRPAALWARLPLQAVLIAWAWRTAAR